MEDIYNNQPVENSDYQVFFSDSEEMGKIQALQYFTQLQENEKHKCNRPTINIKQIVLGLLLPFFITVIVLFYIFLWPSAWFLIIGIALSVLFFIKAFVVFTVLLYQKVAPVRIRCSCRFEPSCSEYMLLSIDKFGFAKGFIKGMGRLFRCHSPNGGIDYP